jgi:hypothetical protein
MSKEEMDGLLTAYRKPPAGYTAAEQAAVDRFSQLMEEAGYGPIET